MVACIKIGVSESFGGWLCDFIEFTIKALEESWSEERNLPRVDKKTGVFGEKDEMEKCPNGQASFVADKGFSGRREWNFSQLAFKLDQFRSS